MKKFEAPIIDVEKLNVMDVITTSCEENYQLPDEEL